MDILHQLGGLVLGSVPTMVFFLLLISAYSFLVERPLSRMLSERTARTSGAVQQARAAMSAAESETEVYEAKLRAARSEILQARDRQLHEWNLRREEALASARHASQEQVKAARIEIEMASIAARRHIEDTTLALSEQIMRAVLPASTLPEVSR